MKADRELATSCVAYWAVAREVRMAMGLAVATARGLERRTRALVNEGGTESNSGQQRWPARKRV